MMQIGVGTERYDEKRTKTWDLGTLLIITPELR